MKRFLLSILCCLLAVVSGYAQGSDDFGTYFTKTNSGYGSGITAAGWKYANAAIVSINNTFAPTINGKTSAKGTITSPTLTGGCDTLSLKYAYTFSESKGVSFKVTIKQVGKEDKSYDVVNSSASQGTIYEWKQDVNVQGDFVIYITNNSPSNSTSNKDRFSIWNIEWTAYGQASVPQLDAPVISPESCTFVTETFDVTISAKDDATIYYTLDGSNPTTGSATYNGVITLTETTTVKAFAVKNGYKDSKVVEAKYTAIDPNVTNYKIVASELGVGNGVAVTSLEFGAVTATFGEGSNSSGNAPTYYTSGTALRAYGGNTITFTGAGGITITEIKFTFGTGGDSNAILANPGTFSENTWTGASNEVVFTIDGTKGNRRIAAIEVTYEGTNSGTPEVENVQAPVISCNKEEYAVGEEAIVTITTETEGAIIYYSLDGSEPTNVYSEAITLTETKTIKAIAKKEGANNSPLTEKTIVFKEVVTLVNATVAEAIAAYKSGKTITENASIIGYIVGAADNSLNKKENFSETTTVKTNLLIADDPNETNVENCMPVELPSGDIRNALNLADNPGNYKKQIVLTGSVEAYFSVAGLKKTSAYEFVEDVWGSLYSPYAVEIPENVKVYIVTGENNGYVKLANITGAVPAMTGVIYNGEWNNKETATSDVADVTGNLLKGSVDDEYVTEDAFVLAKVDGVVGFYKAQMNKQDGNAFLNNANKAYLPASALTASAQGASGFKFRFDNQTTGIESAPALNTAKAIYDLSGRKVNNATAPGLYIINGKKVMVK